MDGRFLLGSRAIETDAKFRAVEAASGAEIPEPAFSISREAHVAEACALAAGAFDSFRETDPDLRAGFLDTIACELEAIGGTLVARAMRESGLPEARLQGELGRTTGQLRLFATVLRRGRWAQATIDQAQPDRAPLPRADIRRRHIGVGPVAVFGASNFPLAFSVAGGDTASALAAGCPVVVKGHPAHPGTSLLVAHAVAAAAGKCGLADGIFSLLQGPSHALGAALVADPRIRAVGFTGSRAAGLALIDIAARRAEPIPVYAEMSSTNPVLLFPAALGSRGEALAKGYVASLTLGAGQFCTNPGLLVAVGGEELDRFERAAAEALQAAGAQVMLTRQICDSFGDGVAALARRPGVETIARGAGAADPAMGQAALLACDAASVISRPELADEVFGACSLVVRARDLDEVADVLGAIGGQLTATMHLDEADEADAARLMPLLERICGRIVVNGWPTGVEVCDAMVHGGPWPATSDPRSTSVGTAAIERFLRPVCYQDVPDALLPGPLKRANPLAMPRIVDGEPR